MRAWRWAMAGLLVGGIGLPALAPLIALFGQPDAWRVFLEPTRLLALAGQTVLLIGGTLLLALPLGAFVAVLLYRSDLPGTRGFRILILVTLFVPLPLFASAWQAVLGAAGLGQPWATGMLPAIAIHALAALPWAIWLTGQGLRWVERELEEAALLDASPWRVLWHVTLPRSRPALAAAALWIALQAAGEITVTDLIQVRTFAEEVYTQLVAGGGAAQSRALAAALPAIFLVGMLVFRVLRHWEAALPSGHLPGQPLVLIHLGRARWPTAIALLLAFGGLTLVPLTGLVWRAGRGGSPAAWSAGQLGEQLFRAVRDDTALLVDSLALAVVAGLLAATLALLACWLALESPWFRGLTLLLMALVWATPGPVLGLGLKDVIEGLMRLEDRLGGPGALRRLLYDGPSILPLVWVTVLRFFPCAVAVLWPVVRRLPRTLTETARLDGAGPLTELRWVLWPLTAPAVRLAGLAVGILSLGELAAGKLVATPGSQTFAHRIFTEMHYGVTNGVAAFCLVVLLAVTVGSVAFLSGRGGG